MGSRASIIADGHRLETAWFGPGPGARAIVLLHEGLGCVSMWREWPDALVRATGMPVFAYSRAGYGGSDPVALPRPLDYMQHEGRVVLPQVLAQVGITEAVLVGHSDGGSIALVFAGQGDPRARGLVALAPHVVCEDLSVRSIALARDAYRNGDLRERLRRHHGDNVDGAFWGWNGAWLDPGFRAWTIEPYLPGVTCPLALVQGEDDEYGTLAQLDRIEAGVPGPCTRHVLEACGHAPHRDRPEATTAVVRAMVGQCFPAGCP